MLVAIHQPNLVPRLRVFLKLAAADRLVVLDTVQFSATAWQNRFLVCSEQASILRSFAVHRPNGRGTMIEDVSMASAPHDRRAAMKTMQRYYAKFRYRQEALDLFEVATDHDCDDLTGASMHVLDKLFGALEIRVRPVRASQLGADRSEKSARLLALTQAVGGDALLVGRGGAAYVNEGLFRSAGVSVVHQIWDGRTHERWSGIPFPNLSILDLIAARGLGEVSRLLVDTKRDRSDLRTSHG